MTYDIHMALLPLATLRYRSRQGLMQLQEDGLRASKAVRRLCGAPRPWGQEALGPTGVDVTRHHASKNKCFPDLTWGASQAAL